jgi:hypothetical protein
MKVQITFPWMADKEVGETELHYGVAFKVTKSADKSCTVVADLPDKEAKAMIEAGRVTETKGGSK